MALRWVSLVSGMALLACACDSGHPRGMTVTARASATATPSAPPTLSARAAAVAPDPVIPPAAAPGHAKAGDIDWHGSLAWHSYQQGLTLAKQNHQPILLMIYADWCSKCRALVPVFERSDVRELVNKMVAIRQDQDDPAPWLSEIGASDSYVPRIIFLDSQGTPLRQVTSGHPRYPFFYMADKPEVLLSSLKQALKI